MSRQKVLMTATAGAGLIGATIYATRKSPTQADENRNRAQQKRDMGLGGAGIGGNHVAGGTERGTALAEKDSGRRQVTTAQSRDELPSGGVGGGEGAGGSSARRTEVPFGGSKLPRLSSGDARGDAKNESITHQVLGTPASGASGSGESWFDSVKGAVGGKTASRKDEEGLHETRGISKMGSETPSKSGPADASDG